MRSPEADRDSKAVAQSAKPIGPNRYGPFQKMVDALSAFADTPAMTASELALKLSIDRSTAQRMLQALVKARWLVRDEDTKRYRIGIRLWELGSLAIARLDLPEAARQTMREIVRATGESTELAILDGVDVVYIERHEGTHEVRVHTRVGARRPAHCMAMGKVLLAHLEVEDRRRRLAPELRGYTERTITSLAALETELEQARRQGWALNRGEYHVDAGGLAAPIFDRNGDCVAALSIDLPVTRLTPERMEVLLPELLRGASETSRRLGNRS